MHAHGGGVAVLAHSALHFPSLTGYSTHLFVCVCVCVYVCVTYDSGGSANLQR